jgi:hypothetical protein
MSVPHSTHNVAEQIFEKFLQTLTDSGISQNTISKLRKTLFEDKKTTEAALEEAILTEESVT